jgi:hypothetical protein
MAYDTIIFKNPITNQTKRAPVGISWTVFFFIFLVPIFRGHWKGAMVLFLTGFFTLGLAYFYFMFAYNKMYINFMLEEGFVADRMAYGDLEVMEKRLGLKLRA